MKQHGQLFFHKNGFQHVVKLVIFLVSLCWGLQSLNLLPRLMDVFPRSQGIVSGVIRSWAGTVPSGSHGFEKIQAEANFGAFAPCVQLPTAFCW